MSRNVLAIYGFIFVIMGILSLIGQSAGWTYFSFSFAYSWLMIVVGIIIAIIAGADYQNQNDK